MHQNAPGIEKNRHNSTKNYKKWLEMNPRWTQDGKIILKNKKRTSNEILFANQRQFEAHLTKKQPIDNIIIN